MEQLLQAKPSFLNKLLWRLMLEPWIFVAVSLLACNSAFRVISHKERVFVDYYMSGWVMNIMRGWKSEIPWKQNKYSTMKYYHRTLLYSTEGLTIQPLFWCHSNSSTHIFSCNMWHNILLLEQSLEYSTPFVICTYDANTVIDSLSWGYFNKGSSEITFQVTEA